MTAITDLPANALTAWRNSDRKQDDRCVGRIVRCTSVLLLAPCSWKTIKKRSGSRSTVSYSVRRESSQLAAGMPQLVTAFIDQLPSPE